MRIDPVHYCKLEAWLADQRKKTSRFDRNGVPEDPAQARLRLLRRTVRDDPTRLGKLVQYLKIPYMLRESAYVELAQTLAVLPNLQYVDLPEGMFSDEHSLSTLRLEVQARCPNLRKMTYLRGSERSFAQLAGGQIWRRLEVLDLNGLNVDPMTMRNVLGSLANLRALKVAETESLSDEVLSYDENLPSLPPLEELVLKDTPRVTTAGVCEYLAWQETQQTLKVLTLKDTGVHPATVNSILMTAPALKVFAYQSNISEPFPIGGAAPLGSSSLETLRYEISGTAKAGPYAGMEEGYHAYLASSVLGGGFPKLRRLYVHDDTFPERLQGLPPPNAAFAGGQVRRGSNSSMTRPTVNLSQQPLSNTNQLAPNNTNHLSPFAPPPRRPISKVPPTDRFSSNNPFASRVISPPPTNTLEVFTKGDEMGKWNFARLDSFHSGRSGGTAGGGQDGETGGTTLRRPVSSYGLAADVAGQGWDPREARRSVMVGSGTGTFLAVPGKETMPRGGLGVPAGGFGSSDASDAWRPHSSGGETRGSRDLWR